MRPELTSTAALARRRVEQASVAHARLCGVREAAQSREAELVVKVAHAKGRLALDEDVTATLEGLQNRAHQRAVGAFERLLSAIVQDVLPGKGEVKLDLGTERGAPALDVQIDNAGSREDALEGSGGAVTNVLSAGLRFAALTRTGNRKLMVLDEPDCWLKPDRVPAFIRVLAEVAEKARTQTILISHHEPTFFEGSVNIVRLSRGADSNVCTELMEPHDTVTWLGDEEPGIRSIRLINFRAHADTTLPLFPGVTALIGDNDLGKSTLAVAALRAVAYGESDDTVIRHGATEARVHIELEKGRRIEWVRKAKGSPRVMYSLYEGGELVHEGRPSGRGQVPEWITDVLGIIPVDTLDIQLGSQKAPVFLLNERPSTRARLLSVGRESGRLHALIDAYADLKRKDRETVREGEAEVAKLRARITASEALPAMVETLGQLAVQAEEVESFTARQAQLAKLLERMTVMVQRKAGLEAKAEALRALPEVPKLSDTRRLTQLVRTLDRTGRKAALRRSFPESTVPVLAEQSRLVKLISTLERASKIVSVRRELPLVAVPALDQTDRLSKLIGTIARTSKVAALRRQFPAPEVPSLSDNRRLTEIGQLIGRLARRSALAKKLPMLPAVADAADLKPMGRQIEVLTARVAARARLERDAVSAADEETAAREDLNELMEAMGGICPACGGELHAVDGEAHAHG